MFNQIFFDFKERRAAQMVLTLTCGSNLLKCFLSLLFAEKINPIRLFMGNIPVYLPLGLRLKNRTE